MLIDPSSVPLWLCILLFAGSAAAIGYGGTKLAHIADELADRTGMGEIIAGALFVGLSTSLPGIITSMLTAYQGFADIAIGNAIGGLTAQTAFLALADMAYRRGNLEHAAATTVGLAQAVLLVTMLVLPLMAYAGPQFAFGWISPISLLLFVVYGFGLRLLLDIHDTPMWIPKDSDLTVNEEEQAKSMPDDPRSDGRLWTLFALFAAMTAVAGYIIGEASIILADQTGLSQTAVGSVFTAIANSLPELVTAIAAVRIGAVNLAIGDIIGGNAFEVLFLAAADFVYFDGSIYDQFDDAAIFNLSTVVLMTGVLLLGMLNRQRSGIANIGWESALVLLLYAGSIAYSFAA